MADWHAIAVEIRAAAPGIDVALDAPLGVFTTYRVGGPASLMVHPVNRAQLDAVAEVLSGIHPHDAGGALPVIAVGNGSNLLIADTGFDGVALRLGEGFATIDVTGTSCRAGAAALLPVVARQTVAAGLTGFEWAVGVPGTIGGAVRMNAGGHGSDMAACVSDADVLDLATATIERWSVDRLDFGYRRSALQRRHVVLSAELVLSEGEAERGNAALAEIVRWRREHQPGGHNAGSVFTNPPGDSAGRLIDASGCKGLRVGTAEVSAKHANFIQVDDGGSAADVRSVMAEVRRRVHDAFGVVLHPETHMVGFAGPLDDLAVDGEDRNEDSEEEAG
ncbi:MAG: UDP-N-acetylmuramate dehydrogenase [Acidimicrobiales bacterium]|nr:UDP-N-acetylmuramate dehydrogenase [Acidimicrobiales bacterium]